MPFAFGNTELLDLKAMFIKFQEVAESVLLHSTGKSEIEFLDGVRILLYQD